MGPMQKGNEPERRQTGKKTDAAANYNYPNRIVASRHHINTQIAKISIEEILESEWIRSSSKENMLRSAKRFHKSADNLSVQKQLKPGRDNKALNAVKSDQEAHKNQQKTTKNARANKQARAGMKPYKRSTSEIELPCRNTTRFNEGPPNIGGPIVMISEPMPKIKFEELMAACYKPRQKKPLILTKAQIAQRAAFEKEQIKQRLEQLRQNTKQLLNKNLRRNKTMNLDFDIGDESSHKKQESSAENLVVVTRKKCIGPKVDTWLTGNTKFNERNRLTGNNENLRKNDIGNNKTEQKLPEETKRKELKCESSSALPQPNVEKSKELTETAQQTEMVLQKKRDAATSPIRKASPRGTEINQTPPTSELALTADKSDKKHVEKATKEQIFANLFRTSEDSVLCSQKPLLENQKRVGLLRKTDNDPKETYVSTSAIPSIFVGKENNRLENMKYLSDGPSTLNSMPPLSLDTPTAQLSATVSKPEDTVSPISDSRQLLLSDKTQITAMQIKRNEPPFWLRPNPIQIYPYNFIMAVRRKLDAIVNPSTTEVTNETHNRRAIISDLPDRTFYKGPASLISSDTTADSSPVTSGLSSKSIELRSNELDGPVELSVTATNSCDIRIHKVLEDDETTVSSSIFDSPKKKYSKLMNEALGYISGSVSPLSLDRVEQLKMDTTSKSTDLLAAISNNHVTTTRGDGLTSRQTQKEEVNLNQLLIDFNRSLSQAMQVNEQLKNKTVRGYKRETIKSSIKMQSNGQSNTSYSTDFEEVTSMASIKKNSKDDHVVVVADISCSTRVNEEPDSTLQKSGVINCTTYRVNVPPEYPSESRQTMCLNSVSSNSKSASSSTKSSQKAKAANKINTGSNNSRRNLFGNDASINIPPLSLHDSENSAQALVCPLKADDYENDNLQWNCHSNGVKSKALGAAQPESPPINKPSLRKAKHNCSSGSAELDSSSIDEIILCEQKSDASQTVGSNLTHEFSPDSTEHVSPVALQCSTKNGDLLAKVNTLRGDYKRDYHHHNHQHHHKDARAHRGTKTKSSYVHGYIELTESRTSTTASCAQAQFPSKGAIPVGTGKSIQHTNAIRTKSLHASETIGSEIVAVFTQSEQEYPELSSHSESSLNYSNLGLYEKLINAETTKSEYLTTLLKIREKVLLDRTKSQIAWLEVQKERYKSRGLLIHIAAIKKKQRAILLKMEREREDIKKLLQNSSVHSSGARLQKLSSSPPLRTTTTTTKKLSPDEQHSREQRVGEERGVPSNNNNKCCTAAGASDVPSLLLPLPLITAKGKRTKSVSSWTPIVRGDYAIESSKSLEELLKRREQDLRRRREHVERLIKWHRRLDKEEAEVLELEHMLVNSNNAVTPLKLNEPITPPQDAKRNSGELNTSSARSEKMERRLKEIDKSLRELNNISNTNISCMAATATDDSSEPVEAVEFVYAIGNKLNNLWRRLTSQNLEKFEPMRRYKLCKADLERIYEDAKMAVVQDFERGEERIAKELLERTTINDDSSNISHNSMQTTENTVQQQQHQQQHQTSRIQLEKTITPLPSSESSYNVHQQSGDVEGDDQNEQNDDSLDDKIKKNTSGSHNYWPCIVEVNFTKSARKASSTAASDTDTVSESSESGSVRKDINERNKLIERNIQKFVSMTKQIVASHSSEGLQRSLSDNQLANTVALEEIKASAKLWCSQSNKSASSRNLASHVFSGGPTEQQQTEIITKKPTRAITNAPKALNIPAQHQLTMDADPPVSQTSNNPQQGPNTEIISRRTVIRSIGNAAAVVTGMKPNVEHQMQQPEVGAQITTNGFGHTSSTSQLLSSPATSAITTNQLPSYESAARSMLSPARSKSTKERNDDVFSTSEEPSSYSYNFEDVSVEIQSPSGCTLKGGGGDEKSTRQSPTESIGGDGNYSATTLHSRTYTKQTHSASTESTPPTPTTATTPTTEAASQQYEADFESVDDETRLEDESMPLFETTLETTTEEHLSTRSTDKSGAGEVDENSSERGPPPPPPPLSQTAHAAETMTKKLTNNHGTSQLMPDIINNLEGRRCQQQAKTESSTERKQYENVPSMPYMYMREIPNKPPPPYVPPAPGSPMTTIFPSEERIRDITFRRSHELYCELSNTDYTNVRGEKLPSVMEEKITNIYERIILDICREYLNDHKDVLTQGDPANFHSQLAFFNPPDRLRCIQSAVYKEVRRCLAMDKSSPKRTQVFSIYGQRARRDHIGKIIIQEMNDEEDQWCSFHREESEVLELMVEEMIAQQALQLAKEMWLEQSGSKAVTSALEDTPLPTFGLPAETNVQTDKMMKPFDATTTEPIVTVRPAANFLNTSTG